MQQLLFLLPISLWLHHIYEVGASGCGPCVRDACRSVTCAAPELLTKDECDCCDRCLSVEGEECGGRDESRSRCAPGMVCVSRSSFGSESSSLSDGTGFCLCEEDGAVCGSDGRTHSSVCALRLHGWKTQRQGESSVHKVHDGECTFGPAPEKNANAESTRNSPRLNCLEDLHKRLSPAGTALVSAPVITVAPKKIHNVTGAQVYLSCEVKAVPTPSISWRKVTESPKGVRLFEELPGDRVNVAVQVRGGPSRHESSSWVMIKPLTKEDEGTYQCHATNMVGDAFAEGSIKVSQHSIRRMKKNHHSSSED
ncbi:insulin-like growth factor-binding protein-like 1 isoform X2 [Dendrobates tinctorius]|uniref:insulin-like growth factor-binding protein-like 1 isoform X2 n=1 Tax=Dendrobates tinctorius TaxID=92724 RepID=UPI003CC9ECF1